jgi:hypothetical protein
MEKINLEVDATGRGERRGPDMRGTNFPFSQPPKAVKVGVKTGQARIAALKVIWELQTPA